MAMLDAVYLGITIVFFFAAGAFLVGCDRLK
jgi:hypothetical protein